MDRICDINESKNSRFISKVISLYRKRKRCLIQTRIYVYRLPLTHEEISKIICFQMEYSSNVFHLDKQCFTGDVARVIEIHKGTREQN